MNRKLKINFKKPKSALVSTADNNDRNDNKNIKNPLFQACEINNVEYLKNHFDTVINNNINIDIKENSDSLPYYYNDFDIKEDIEEKSLLHVIVGFNSIDCLLFIIDKLPLFLSDKYINYQDKLGRTPLMYACSWNSADCVAILLHYKPDVNLGDNDGNACIHACCSYFALKSLEILIL